MVLKFFVKSIPMRKLDIITRCTANRFTLIKYLHNSSATLGCKTSQEDSKTQIFQCISQPIEQSQNKVSIIGVGRAGVAIAVGLLSQKVTSHIALCDSDEKRIKGEMYDLQHGSCYLNSPKIEADMKIEVTASSRVCVLAMGDAYGEPNVTMNELAKKNGELIKTIVPSIFKHSPNTVLLVITRPIEAITYACSKLTNTPPHRIIGTGCNLDSIRLRFYMSQKYKIATKSCRAWVIGENGPSSVVLWSSATVAGVRLCTINPLIGTTCDPENWKEVHERVIKSDSELLAMKGSESWSIAGNVIDMIGCILNNTRRVFSLSVAARGYYGICEDVYCSLPCVLGQDGISDVLTVPITDNEHRQLMKSVSVIRELQKAIPV